MNRTIETRLTRLEAVAAPAKPRKSHIVAAQTDEEWEAAKADLMSRGTATPDDFFIQLVAVAPRESV